MRKILKDLIQYNGIDECYYNNLKNFTQFSIDDIICIPEYKPDMSQITKVWADYKISNYEFIDTPKGTSFEGQNLTGRKVFVSAELSLKIEYVSMKKCQTIYSTHTTIPVCTYVTIEDTYSECSSIYPTILIEDVYCEQINSQKIYFNALLLAIIDIC